MEFTGERLVPEINKDEDIYLEHVSRYFFSSQFVKNKVILDIACGSGYGSDLLLKAGASEVIGVDNSEEAINYCKNKYKNEKLKFIIGRINKIPLRDDAVDVVISLETIEHVDEKTQYEFLEETKRVLRPGGKLIVSTPNVLISQARNPFHLRELSLEEFKSLLRKYFKKLEIFYQDNVQSDYIFSENILKKEIVSELKRPLKIRKINTLVPTESQYFIAVCQDESEDNFIDEYVTIFNLKPRLLLAELHKNYQGGIKNIKNELKGVIQQKNEEIEQKNEIIQQKNEEIEQKNAEIELMKSSKFWKMREKYISLKKSLTLNIKK